MKRLIITIAFFAACGAQNKDGTCKEYKPAMSCPTGQNYVCDTDGEGCTRCTCVPNDSIPEAPGYDD